MFVVEATYDGGPAVRGREDQRWEFDQGDRQDLERAAQRFESEAGVPASWSLSQIVEDLSLEGKVEYEDWERCMTFVAYELVEAVV